MENKLDSIILILEKEKKFQIINNNNYKEEDWYFIYKFDKMFGFIINY